MKAKENSRLLEILSQTSSLEELDTKVRIRFQEALINFLRDPEKWLLLPRGEVDRLLRQLVSRSRSSSPFLEKVELFCRDADGHLISKQEQLDFDAYRNKNLSDLLSRIVNQEIAVVFQESFGFGLIEHLERLISMEMELKELDEDDLRGKVQDERLIEAGNFTLELENIEIEDRLPPLSPQDISYLRMENLGIMVELIPKFVRMPLNKLYHVITKRSKYFPALALQFYLSNYYASRELVTLDRYTPTSQKLVRSFFTKAFYAIHRLGGLTIKELHLPEAKRFERYEYMTVDDEDPTPVIKIVTTGVQRLVLVKEKLAKLKQNEQNIRSLKRQQYRVLMEVDLSLEKILTQLFNEYRYQLEKAQETTDQLQLLSLTLWLPQNIEPLDPWEREIIESHLDLITSEDYRVHLPTYERELIESWPRLAEDACTRKETLAMLEALGEPDQMELFKREILVRLAQQHKAIIEQNLQYVLDQVGQQITRMLRMGTLTPSLLMKQRYKDFQLHVLPYIYYFEAMDGNQNKVWVKSPFPFCKMLNLIEILEDSSTTTAEIKGDPVDLALTRELLKEMLSVEYSNLEGGETFDYDTQSPDEVGKVRDYPEEIIEEQEWDPSYEGFVDESQTMNPPASVPLEAHPDPLEAAE